jgi:hypothetical protein
MAASAFRNGANEELSRRSAKLVAEPLPHPVAGVVDRRKAGAKQEVE